MDRTRREGQRSWLLAPIAATGQLLVAFLTAGLAQRLSLGEFEAYALASAAFMLCVTVAPFGAEKLALRVLPPLIDCGDWPQVRAYLRFALRRSLLGTVLVGAAALAWAFGARDFSGATRAAFAVGVLVLPIGVLAHVGLEVLTAAGAAGFAAVLVRLVVPATALGLVLSLPALAVPLTGAVAVAAWGIGWAVAGLLMLARARSSLSGLRRSRPGGQGADWRLAAHPFWLYRAAVGLMAQAGILALDWLGASAAAVGAYAAATTVVGLGLVLSTATNRAYSREIAILIKRGAAGEYAGLARRRRRWLLPCIAAFVIAVFVFSRPLLAAFRPEFVAEGLWPIRILALAAAVSMPLALAPTVLKYSGRNRAILCIVAAAAALQIVLLVVLVPRLGATGAAMGYGLASSLMYGAFAWLARDEIGRLRPPAGPGQRPLRSDRTAR